MIGSWDPQTGVIYIYIYIYIYTLILHTILKLSRKNQLKKDPELSNTTLIINRIIRVKGPKGPIRPKEPQHIHIHIHIYIQIHIHLHKHV